MCWDYPFSSIDSIEQKKQTKKNAIFPASTYLSTDQSFQAGAFRFPSEASNKTQPWWKVTPFFLISKIIQWYCKIIVQPIFIKQTPPSESVGAKGHFHFLKFTLALIFRNNQTRFEPNQESTYFVTQSLQFLWTRLSWGRVLSQTWRTSSQKLAPWWTPTTRLG